MPRAPEDQTRIMLRPIGSGLPLGFFSFGIAEAGRKRSGKRFWYAAMIGSSGANT